MKATVKNPQVTKRKISREAFLIESLKTVVHGIAQTFGLRCEVVLHDLRNMKNLDHSIIEIANNHITGRAIGGPISDQGLRDLRSGLRRSLNINYPSSTKNGRPLKSSTILLSNEKGKPITALCINFDITDIVNFQNMIQDIFGTSEVTYGPESPELKETFESNIASTLEKIASYAIRNSGKTVVTMERKDKIEIVRQLEQQGYFLIKGAIKLIATKLNVTKFTIYNYLEEAKIAKQA